MNAVPSRGRPGFTLVELLTVIAVIMLLIGILIPALSAARTQAKKTATAGLLKSIDVGCEMFSGDFKHYPQSRGYNPFEGGDVVLNGAQWLALQLVGADRRGYVNPVVENDSDGNRVIDDADWLDWYSLQPQRQYTRMGPYADVDAKSTRTVEQILSTDPEIRTIPEPLMGDAAGGAGGSSQWNNGRIPFFIDAFGYPVLYYRANPKVDAPFTTGTPSGDFVVGRYDQTDNMFFTASDGNNGRYGGMSGPGWDLSASGLDHPLGEFGYVPDQTSWPEPRTFAAFVCDANIYETTAVSSGGRLWPYKPDSFLLISAGSDAVYGTGDDVTNFQAGR